MRGALTSAIAGLATSLALCATATAAYAPKVTVTVDPPSPRAAVAITSTVTQAADETPNKTVRLSFPEGWSTATNTLTECSNAQAAASKCPDSSQMGTAKAEAVVLAPATTSLTGKVYLGTSLQIWVFLSNGAINQTVRGVATIEGLRLVSTFDNLPNTLTTFFQLKLFGPPKSLAQTGFGCGDKVFDGEFTSQKGEMATAHATVTIVGCPDRPPVVSGLEIAPNPVKSAKGGTLKFGLDQPAQVVVTIEKRGASKTLQTFTVNGKAESTTKVKGVAKGLAKGKYVARIKATDTGGQVRTKKFGFAVK